MTKHYVLSLDPAAEYEWDRCVLRDPITAERPELAQLVAESIGRQAGSYLISVDIKVTVLEKSVATQPKPIAVGAARQANLQPEERVA
jgi:hypothetical protein